MTRMRKAVALLCVALVTVLFCLPAYAADGSIVPEGYLDKNNRVTILDGESFIYFINQINSGNTYNGKYVSLRGDFDLGGHEFKDSGTFSGTLDGCGHKVTNFKVTENTAKSTGLISKVQNGTVKNLTIDDATVTNNYITKFLGITFKSYTGGLVGTLLGHSAMTNCVAGKDVQVFGVNPGGLCAEIGTSSGEDTVVTMSNCVNYGTVTGLGTSLGSYTSKCGGVLGYVGAVGAGCLIVNCKNYGTVTKGDAGCAGIVGYANACFINNCVNYGTISDSKVSGGIVGYETAHAGTDSSNAAYLECKNYGTVDGTEFVGGIVGRAMGTAADDENGIGGAFTVRDCENHGKVGGTENTPYAGGIIGSLEGCAVYHCTNTEEVSSGRCAGGVVGKCAVGYYDSVTGPRIVDCSGGSAKIQAPNPGRILGTLWSYNNTTKGNRIDLLTDASTDEKTKHRSVNYLSIDDGNGDSYDGISTVGYTDYLRGAPILIVEKGTFHGTVANGSDGAAGNSGALLIFEKEASWDATPDDSNGSMHEYRQVKNVGWELNYAFSKVEKKSDSTCSSAGERVYNALIHTEKVTTTTEVSDTETVHPATLSYSKDAKNGIAKCTLTVKNADMGNLFQTTTFDNMRFTLTIPEGLSYYGCSEKTNSNILFTNFSTPSQGCYTQVDRNAKNFTITAHDLYRRDGSHNIYDGSNPSYPKTDLYDRATTQGWNATSFNGTTITFSFYLKAEDAAQLDTLMGEVTAGFGFVDYAENIPTYLFNATTTNPTPTLGKIVTTSTSEDIYTDTQVHTEALPTLAHSYQLTSTVAPTCSTDGSETFTCELCGLTKTLKLPANGEHKENTAHPGVDQSNLDADEGAYREPTTTKEGVGRWYCPDCGCTDVYAIPPVASIVTPKAAAYQVEYYKENLDGTYSPVTEDLQILMDELGKTVTAPEKTYEHYTERTEPDEATGTVVMPTAGEDGTPKILVLKRYYNLDTHTVSFDLNGGTGTVDDQTVKYGATIPLPEAPTKKHFAFKGWKVGDDIYQPGDSFVVSGNTEFTAQWEEIPEGQTPTTVKPADKTPTDKKPASGVNTGDTSEMGLWLALLGTAGALAYVLTKQKKNRA